MGGGQQWEYNHQGDDGLRWRLRVDWGGKQLNVSGNCGRFPGGRSFAEQANLPKGIARRYYSFAPGTEFDPFLTALKRLMKRPEYNGF